MDKRTITGKLALYFLGMVNMLMVLGPVLLPAYRNIIKNQYSRIWRNRNIRRNNDLFEITISQREFDQYREGQHEIWLGHRLYDIETIRKDSAGLHLAVEFDEEETRELDALSHLQQDHPVGHEGKDVSARWLNWLSELVQVQTSPALPQPAFKHLALQYQGYSSAIRHSYQPVGQQPPDVQFVF
jgi:hypothetical protein